jgi:transposase-like protein
MSTSTASTVNGKKRANDIRRRTRRLTPAEKAQIVEESCYPGVTTREIADQYGISSQLLFNWRHLARNGHLPVSVSVLNGNDRPRSHKPATDEKTADKTHAEPSSTASQDQENDRTVEIRRGDVSVHVPADVSAAQIGAIARELAG